MDPMEFILRLQAQWAEVLGEVNRYYCSKAARRDVRDRETLWRYFVKSGGAEDFAERWAEAMGDQNRWFCSEFYVQEINDPRVLWAYYMAKHDGDEPPPLGACGRAFCRI
jgi:hypothetical protein